jgi:hypothetical protein
MGAREHTQAEGARIMPAQILDFERGKVYCLGINAANAQGSKRIVRYQGPGQPWEDVCSGEAAVIEPSAIADVIEVPPTVVDAIKLAQDKRPLPAELPCNAYGYGDDDEPDAWELDVYADDQED